MQCVGQIVVNAPRVDKEVRQENPAFSSSYGS